jgi:CheY-like chemotaxis protein/anti-sigma regulatory factor (Ser/Thr protein kinase)
METMLLNTNLSADNSAPKAMRTHLQKVLQSLNVPISTCRKIELITSEIVTNIVKHNNMNHTNISLKFGKFSKGYWLDIYDDGEMFNPLKANLPDLDNTFLLLESSRGLYLIQSQCEHVEYEYLNKIKNNKIRCTWQDDNVRVGPSLLLVDDSEIELEILKNLLTEQFTVFTATNGLDAITVIENNSIDIIISDLHMPTINGVDLYVYLEKHLEKVIPFIFLTSDTNETLGLLKDAYQVGADDVLTKPIIQSSLTNAITRVLKRNHQIKRRLSDKIDKTISSSLLPDIPERIKKWNVAVGYRNTGKGGGDFLLHNAALYNDTIALVDIMGHDESAKFFSFSYAGYLRGLMFNNDLCEHPEKLLTALSDMALTDKLFSSTNLTCCVLNLNLDSEIQYASAGHPPALLINSDGIRPLTANGILPGIIADTAYTSETVKLKAGERLAIYTDGLFDSAEDAAGRDALKLLIEETLIATATLDVQSALDKTLHVFDQFTFERPKDDVVLCLIDT